ncbi:MAG: hypothetical protein KIT83_05380 [Bryobacterales bacterium]|nr:hypothetical protein [Bryobacterales bacterium]
MTGTFCYPAVFRLQADSRLLDSFPDSPAARTNGATVQEAMEEAIDCLAASSLM